MNYLSIREAALISGNHTETLGEACRLGELHGAQRKKGGSWKIQQPCLEAWIAGEKCEHQAAELKAAA